MIDPNKVDGDNRELLANERTLLSWTRTALAFIVGGIAVVQFLEPGSAGGLRQPVAIGLILAGAVLAIASFVSWKHRDRILRDGETIGPSRMPLTMLITFIAASAVALLLVFQH